MLPISPKKVPTLDAAEFERQQQALERNVGTAGGVGATTKAAGNESIDGCMTACDDEIGRRTTT